MRSRPPRARGRFVRGLFADLLGVVGVVSVTFGAWLILPAAGFIVGGILAIATGGLIANRDREIVEPPDEE